MSRNSPVNESGKRKTAVARSTVKEGDGNVTINNVPLELYEPQTMRLRLKEPLVIAGEEITDDIDIEVTVEGGGKTGQTAAARTAIARGIWKYTGDDSLRELYMERDRYLIINDVRQKEPKKFGGRGARARRQKSYR